MVGWEGDICPGAFLVAIWFYLLFQIGFLIYENVDVPPTGEI